MGETLASLRLKCRLTGVWSVSSSGYLSLRCSFSSSASCYSVGMLASAMKWQAALGHSATLACFRLVLPDYLLVKWSADKTIFFTFLNFNISIYIAINKYHEF